MKILKFFITSRQKNESESKQIDINTTEEKQPGLLDQIDNIITKAAEPVAKPGMFKIELLLFKFK